MEKERFKDFRLTVLENLAGERGWETPAAVAAFVDGVNYAKEAAFTDVAAPYVEAWSEYGGRLVGPQGLHYTLTSSAMGETSTAFFPTHEEALKGLKVTESAHNLIASMFEGAELSIGFPKIAEGTVAETFVVMGDGSIIDKDNIQTLFE